MLVVAEMRNSMTKKDYVLIADSIYRTIQVQNWTEKNKVRKQAKYAAMRLVANDLAGSLYGDNPRFDCERFLKACGVYTDEQWEQDSVQTLKDVMSE